MVFQPSRRGADNVRYLRITAQNTLWNSGGLPLRCKRRKDGSDRFRPVGRAVRSLTSRIRSPKNPAYFNSTYFDEIYHADGV